MHQVTLTKEEVLEILEGIRQVKICVVGDICLDMYWQADMTRSQISRETPHFPLPVVEERYAPGAGGNVLQNIFDLGVLQLLPISAIGNDWRGFLLNQWLEQKGIFTNGLLRRKAGFTNCYCKPLRKGISEVVYEDPRIDFVNDQPLTDPEEDHLLALLKAAAQEADVVAVCDQYACGVITPKIRAYLSELGQTKPVVVDSRDRAALYCNVILKPNEIESALAVGQDPATLTVSAEAYAPIGSALSKATGRPAVVTLGALGALWCNGQNVAFAPTVKATPPIDIVGAGDTFLSAFCCAYAACKNGPKALAFANLASGVTVQKVGTTGTATPAEILAKWEEHNPCKL